MTIKYKSVARPEPGVAGGGTKKYYASIVRSDRIDIRTFAEEISEMSTHTTGDVFGILELFLKRVKSHVMAGRSVDLWDLGTFWPSIRSTASDTPLEVGGRNIKQLKVLFRPSGYMKHQLSYVQFKKVDNAITEQPEA